MTFARFGLRAMRIHNVAETRSLPYRHRQRPGPVFLHNRGLASEYNPACTLRAFAIVQQRYPEARLTIAHDGPLRPALEASSPIAGPASNTIHRFCFARADGGPV